MLTDDFNFDLPPDLIAQHPTPERDRSRLMVFERPGGAIRHAKFTDFPDLLTAGDLLVLNDSKVIPARLRGIKSGSGGAIEFLLLEENALNDWWVMLRPAKRLRPGDSFKFTNLKNEPTTAQATLLEKNEEGHCRLRFENVTNILDVAHEYGEMPLPPYIQRAPGRPSREDLERYQTVFAKSEGSVAAPTAGLHFTPQTFEKLKSRDIDHAFVTLHVGAGTFAPVKTDRVENHRMHEERYEIPEATFKKIELTKKRRGNIVCVGTTSLRVLESAARDNWKPGPGRTRIFIYPPYDFKIAGALLTNFHLPKSTLLMLVSAFAAPNSPHGREKVLHAYREAIKEKYRFFSYGDAMYLTPLFWSARGLPPLSISATKAP
jgi:S-adenosylmethionine:tRNA ribosyltransferase-isomerase